MLRRPARQGGAALVELHVVALFALLPMGFGLLQAAWLQREGHYLDYAAFLAARAGSVTNGDPEAMRAAYARGAAVLFLDAGSPLTSANVAARVAQAHAAARLDLLAHARFRLHGPSPAAQADFGLVRDGRRVVPNDGLQYRPATPGARSGVTVQQANLLDLEVEYCRPLRVPLAAQLLRGTLAAIDRDPWHLACYAAGRVPVRSRTSTPMQSDFRVSS